MSDLIRYAAGNTARRDHINWPTLLRSQIDTVIGVLTEDERDVRWPVDVSLLQIMALCWRVKKWHLEGECACSVRRVQTVSPFADNTWDGDADIEGDIAFAKLDSQPATRERDLLSSIFDTVKYRALINGGVGSPIGLPSPVSTWETFFDASPSASGAADLSVGFLFGFHLFDVDTEMFSPPFSGFGDPPGTLGNVIPVDHTATINQLGLTITFDRNPETDTSPASPVRILAPGNLTVSPGIQPDFDVPLQLAAQLDFFDVDSILTGSASGDFTLTATEFWPYADSNGLPIYDTGTGAQLRDPFG